MNITTKYNVGDRYWVARCYKKHVSIERVIDGAKWTKEDLVLTPHVKEKKIVGITIGVSKKDEVKIQYRVTDVEPSPYTLTHDDTFTLPTLIEEDKLKMLSKDDAIHMSLTYFGKGEEYYG